MEPLRGGQLTNQVPTPIQAIWDGASIERTPADGALQWLWTQAAVSVVLSGMSAVEQVEGNVESAARSRTSLLSDGKLAIIGRVQAQYRELCPLPCTECWYCLPWPSGFTSEDERRARIIRNDLMKGQRRDGPALCLRRMPGHMHPANRDPRMAGKSSRLPLPGVSSERANMAHTKGNGRGSDTRTTPSISEDFLIGTAFSALVGGVIAGITLVL
jgi:hypothetical protein